MSEVDNGRITFTVKELLAKMDGKLDAIAEKIEAKADELDLRQLEGRVSSLEKWRYGLALLAAAALTCAGYAVAFLS